MEEENDSVSTTRVRMNFKQTAKGAGQMDITSEAPTVEEAKKMMADAIDEMRAIFKEKGIEEAHA